MYSVVIGILVCTLSCWDSRESLKGEEEWVYDERGLGTCGKTPEASVSTSSIHLKIKTSTFDSELIVCLFLPEKTNGAGKVKSFLNSGQQVYRL